MTLYDRAVLHWRIAFFLWFVLLTTATHFPQEIPTGEPFFESPDKLLHFVSFGILGLLFMQGNWVKSGRMSWLIVATLAVVDEITQDILPLGRSFSYEDLISGELGIVSAFSWRGALSRPSMIEFKEVVESVFSSTRYWVLLALSSVISTVFMTTALWVLLYVSFGTKQSSVSFFVSFIVTSILIILEISGYGNKREEMVKSIKSMVFPLLGTIALAAMVGFLVMFTPFEPLVAMLFILIVGSRISWDIST